ncbi:hypothetical protein CPB83DRAFT_859156 [Crepidotus variabilis]|uniref:Uncharacterized protein n=1 Tax=Crepidotus variabilis TaxID=179855 RepID=A0A9P6EB05_9AGAR|nr:hypothetical protein CPB83DRAFT_859156 [Crepidotus variabilis]
MKSIYLLVLACFSFAVSGILAVPVPGKNMKIYKEGEQTKEHGDKIKTLKETEADAHFGINQALRVANFPENQENESIMVKAFNKDFHPHVDLIRQTLKAMYKGKLMVRKVNDNSDAMKGRPARVRSSNKEASFGPSFYDLGNRQRAFGFTHEVSHAMANTKDCFAKADGRPLSTEESKHIDHFIGYQQNDHASLQSQSSVQNADSYAILAELAVDQYWAHKEHPPKKK